jgi:DNA (cytosine-5)-methyltransferase 1
LKILNLYAGIGGNRKLWGDEHEITAVEINPKIAECYKKLFPNDNVIVDDAHEYLRKHFREFDFIWASPPCQTHSQLQLSHKIDSEKKFPDMKLYQEIIFLKHYFKRKWVVENVKPFYTPLIPPTFIIDRHYFWASNFIMTPQFNDGYTSIRDNAQAMADAYGYDMDVLKSCGVECRLVLRNLVVPEVGKTIFDLLTK